MLLLFLLPLLPTVLAQLALTLCVHPIVKHSRDGDGAVLLAGAVAAAIGVVFGKRHNRRARREYPRFEAQLPEKTVSGRDLRAPLAAAADRTDCFGSVNPRGHSRVDVGRETARCQRRTLAGRIGVWLNFCFILLRVSVRAPFFS